MYTLRRITKSGVTDNICLGKRYSVIKESDSYEEFEKIQKQTEGSVLNEVTYAYVRDENHSPIPLYKDNNHYIVTESGSTLERL